MTKKYYQILGVSETATRAEIKKAYWKLALKWHPDKQSSKSVEERKQANEKMQEINQAYEILGDEDKRKRYDLGETNFAPEFDWDSYYEAEKARLAAEREQIKLDRKILAYRELISSTNFQMHLADIFSEYLDSNLWVPYSDWREKMRSLEVIVDENGVDEVNSPAFKFRVEMFAAIKKRREELDNGINNPFLEKTKSSAIEVIERNLKERNLKVEDLDERYRNYHKHINGLIKVWKIRDFRDEVIENINTVSRRKDYEKWNSYTEQPSKNSLWKDLIFFRSNNT